jgi:hypothetical protein
MIVDPFCCWEHDLRYIAMFNETSSDGLRRSATTGKPEDS